MQDGDRVGKKLQDETTHGGVEKFLTDDLIHIELCEAHIVKAGLGNTRSSASDGARVAFDADDFSRRTNQVGRQHGDVTNAGTDIQDTLTCANAGFAEKSFGERSEAGSLPNEALVLGVGAAEGVARSGIACRHDGRGLYHRVCARLSRQIRGGGDCGDAYRISGFRVFGRFSPEVYS